MLEPHAPLDICMARLARGDRTVFAQVFQQLWAPMFGLCVTLLRNEADASDAAQEAMHKLLERASDYDPKRPAMPWALALAGWECRTWLKRRARRREVLEGDAQEFSDTCAEQDFVRRDLMQAAVAALGELSATDREALIATFWEESAAVSGATLRKRRARALARLRDVCRRLYGLD